MKKALSLLCLILVLVPSCAGKVEPLGVFGRSRMAEVLGQDGVTPVTISETVTMWTFGDTLLGSWKGEVSASATFSDATHVESMISNSIAFTERPTPENIGRLKFTYVKKDGRVSQVIGLKAGERAERDRLWAADGIRIEDRVFVYYMRIKISERGGPMAFKSAGTGLALWAVPAGWRVGDAVRFIRLPDLFPPDFPAFGACVMERNGWLYTIGHYAAAGGTSPVKISRVRKGDIARGASYEFLADDGRWLGDVKRAGPFLGDVAGECSLSYNEYLKCYVIIYCQLYTGRIIMARFRDFEGLGSAKKEVLYSPPPVADKGRGALSLYYSGKEILASGRTLFAIYIHPLEYQPYLLKIRL